ncbi:hypothetical protein LDENG_00246020 [Lucifuga dentata]|nr:hypothetical protein LDENG_00246020 [Lucifuga dentata]
MVWTCKGCGVYLEKDAEDGAARQDEKRKVKEEVYRCGKRGHAGGRRHGGGRRGQGEMEADDPLWRPIKGAVKRRRSNKPRSGIQRRFESALSNDRQELDPCINISRC